MTPITYRLPAQRLNAAAQKYIAATTMLIDHAAAILIGAGVLPQSTSLAPVTVVYIFARAVGRIAFPIFALMLTEGAVYTHSRWEYLLHMLIFGATTEPLYDLAFYDSLVDMQSQNAMFTLAAGLVAIMLWDACKKLVVRRPISLALGSIAVASVAIAAEAANLSYGAPGIAAIFALYALREQNFAKSVSATAILSTLNPLAPFSILAIPMLIRYNGQRGNAPKYFFYVFYPAHLAVLHAIHLSVVKYL